MGTSHSSLVFGLAALTFSAYALALAVNTLRTGKIRVVRRHHVPYDVTRLNNTPAFWLHFALEVAFTIGAAIFAWHFLRGGH